MESILFLGRGGDLREGITKVDAVASAERSDKAGARRPETRRAGRICVKSFGFRLGRSPATPFADPLDLAANSLRQNDPI